MTLDEAKKIFVDTVKEGGISRFQVNNDSMIMLHDGHTISFAEADKLLANILEGGR